MNGLRSLIDGLNAPTLSRWLIGISTLLLTGWLQAHLLLAAIHDDGTTVRNALVVYNSPEVRGQLAGATDWVFEQGAALSGASAELAPLQAALRGAVGAGRLPDAAVDALVLAVVDLRDEALEQFASDRPARPLMLEVEPLLAAFGIAVPPDLAATMGLVPGAPLAVPIADAQTVDTLRTRYHWAQVLDSWGLLVGSIAGAVGIVLARRPLRALAITLIAAGAACLVAIPLFGLLRDWLVAGGVGPWSPLVTPLVTAGMAEVSPWLVPVGIAGVVAGAALLGFLVVRERRAGAPRPPEAADQDERATLASTPWTKGPDSSVENSLANSTASSIATASGTSSL